MSGVQRSPLHENESPHQANAYTLRDLCLCVFDIQNQLSMHHEICVCSAATINKQVRFDGNPRDDRLPSAAA